MILALLFVVGSVIGYTGEASASKRIGIEYYFHNDQYYNEIRELYYVEKPKNDVITVKIGDTIELRTDDKTDRMNEGWGPMDQKIKISNEKIAKRLNDWEVKAKRVGITKLKVSFTWGFGKMKGVTLSRIYKVKVTPRITAKEADVAPKLKEIASNVVKGSKLKVMFTNDFGKDKFDICESIVYLTPKCNEDLTDFKVNKEDASIDARIKYQLYKYYMDGEDIHVEERVEDKFMPLVNKIKGFRVKRPHWTYKIEYKSSDELDEFDLMID